MSGDRSSFIGLNVHRVDDCNKRRRLWPESDHTSVPRCLFVAHNNTINHSVSTLSRYNAIMLLYHGNIARAMNIDTLTI